MARVSTLTLSATLAFAALASARGEPVDSPHVQPAIVNQLPKVEEVRAFAGTIVSENGGTFFLQDDVNKMLYGLDNQALAAKFVDQKVLVTGTLDKTATIHVKSIEEQKA